MGHPARLNDYAYALRLDDLRGDECERGTGGHGERVEEEGGAASGAVCRQVNRKANANARSKAPLKPKERQRRA